MSFYVYRQICSRPENNDHTADPLSLRNENRVSPGQSMILELQTDHSANEELFGMSSSNLTRGGGEEG